MAGKRESLAKRHEATKNRRGWFALALAGFYALGAVGMALGGGAALVSIVPAHAAPHAGAGLVPGDGDNNTTGDNDSGGDHGGDNATCSSNNSTEDDQGENETGDGGGNNSTEDDQGGNDTGDGGASNGTEGDLSIAAVHLADNNTTDNDTGENESGDDGGDNGTGENDTGENETGDGDHEGDHGGCGGDPPVTFKALGLPSGSTWSVAAGSPVVTLSNTTSGHKGSMTFNESNGTLNYTITAPSGFGVERVLGHGGPSQTSDNISGKTVLTVKFSPIVTLTFVEKGLPVGDVWSVQISSSFPHGGPGGASGSNTTTASGGAITFSVVTGPWKYNVTGVPTNFTVHPAHGTVGVNHGHHPASKTLRFRAVAPAGLPSGAAPLVAAVTRV